MNQKLTWTPLHFELPIRCLSGLGNSNVPRQGLAVSRMAEVYTYVFNIHLFRASGFQNLGASEITSSGIERSKSSGQNVDASECQR